MGLRRSLITLLCLGVVLFGMVTPRMAHGFANVSFPAHLAATADWDPEEKATQLAAALHGAETVSDVEEILNDILELIGIGVYDVYGTPIRLGNEKSPDDFFLYGFETRLVAEGFLAQRYLSLEAIVESWQSMGIPIVPIGQQRAELVSAKEVEKTLRALRSTAESEPQHPAGFWIRLVDELGNREELPLDLLDDEEPVIEGLAPGMKAMLQEQMDLIRKDAQKSGDGEMLDRLDVLETEAGQAALLEAMVAGDMFRMMQLLMGEETISELASGMREIEQDLRGEEDAPEELRHMLGTAGQFFAGMDVDFTKLADASFDFLRGTTDWQEMEFQEMRQKAKETSINNYRKAQTGSARGYSSSIYDADTTVAGYATEFEFVENERDELALAVEEWEKEYEQMKQIVEEFEEKFGKPILDDQEVSQLHLDPIQSLLLHIDMFLESRETASSAGWMQGGLQWITQRFNLVAKAQGSCNIGGSQGQFSDSFGALNGLLSTASSIKGIMSDVRDLGTQSYSAAAKTIVRGAVQTAATELHVDVFYHAGGSVVKGAPENPRADIHMRHGEEIDERRIQIQVRLESPFLDALSDVLSQIDHNRACGPIRDLLGAPDPLKELHDLADVDFANVPIRFQPESEFLTRFLLVKADWDGYRSSTFTKRTNDSGIADGFFYLQKEDPDIGGWTEVTPGPVRVQAMVNASAAAIYNPAAWGLAVGEEIFRPVQTYVQLRVEHHIPIARSGSLTLTRTVTERGNANRKDSEEASEFTRSGSGTLRVTVTNLRMDEQGAISADYQANLTGNWREVDFQSHLVECKENGDSNNNDSDSSRKVWVETTKITNGVVQGSASGQTNALIFLVDSRLDTYQIWPGPLLLQIANQINISGQETVRIIRKGCEGVDDDSRDPEPVQQLESFMHTHLFHPVRLFADDRPNFPRTTGLRATSNWTRTIPNEEIRAAFGAPPPKFVYNITTNLDWDLTPN